MFGCHAQIDIITIALNPGPVTSKTGNLTWLAFHGFCGALQLQTQARADGKQNWLLVPGGMGTRDLVQNQVYMMIMIIIYDFLLT
jgi:hypothetical protein